MSCSKDIVVLHPRTGVAVAEFTSEHDVSSKQAVRELLGRLVDEHELVVADISEAEFIDSSIISCLLSADKQSRIHGKRFRLQLGTAPYRSTRDRDHRGLRDPRSRKHEGRSSQRGALGQRRNTVPAAWNQVPG